MPSGIRVGWPAVVCEAARGANQSGRTGWSAVLGSNALQK